MSLLLLWCQHGAGEGTFLLLLSLVSHFCCYVLAVRYIVSHPITTTISVHRLSPVVGLPTLLCKLWTNGASWSACPMTSTFSFRDPQSSSSLARLPRHSMACLSRSKTFRLVQNIILIVSDHQDKCVHAAR
jgi:hypothetical protein